ncbi:hypothetical protein PC129_g11344 [Phytophthora cactorum]|uniref:Uncharacterized protein n=1 Tax=Phytophthora cactorum TaxID=29920 RepID=A0A329T3K8_9STRA|nr:hypothetical protein Pcac1_g11373 [Phytophthora cactorum]KAG2817263.1 hypothetical protein PC112_g13135 [Phytophthora cactorum]KAG2819332.1 hypothetical protein PC111_g11945 [Phytophthora cactorum]KAG2854221.1 hypothetical protein PC113_g13505 [Phytophthora cactorum]KAG2898653.1 hypothetical protein PC114_g14219 [Phytophthora cactorum]
MASDHGDHALHETQAYGDQDDVMLELLGRNGHAVEKEEDDVLNILAEEAANDLAQTTCTVKSAALAAGLQGRLSPETRNAKHIDIPGFADYWSTSRWSYNLNEYQADGEGFGLTFMKNVKELKGQFAALANSK